MVVAKLASRVFGRHFKEIGAGPFACTVSRATVRKEDLPEHIHEDAQLILAIDPGYLSRAFDKDAQGAGFDLIYNPAGTVHRDCFFRVGGRFLSVSVPRSVAVPCDSPLALHSERAREAAGRLLGLCILGSDPLALEESILDVLAAAARNDGNRGRPAWMGKADELIAASATDPQATVAALAGRLGLHPVYFARAYRSATGRGPAKALQSRRMAAAVAMLSRDRSLADVAAACGFADQSHLCRSMRSAVGVTPGVFRAAFGGARVANVQDGLRRDW